MAIGDAVAAIMGTATTNRQPSAGVEEQISSLLKTATTDEPAMYDGTTAIVILRDDARTDLNAGEAQRTQHMMMNLALMSTNSVYFRKPGTTDRIYLGGVQTNA